MATNDSGSDTAETKRVRIPSKHPSFYAMVTEALTKLDDRKGVSVQAIRAFILETYKTVDPNKLKFRMKIALAKGIENGIFKRPKASEDQKGATGRFKIDKTVMEAANKPNKPKKVKKPKPDEEKKKPKSKSKVAKMNETKEKSILKSTKKTPAKSRAKSPKVKKTSKSKSDSPKKTKPRKKLIDEPAKPKSKAKTAPKKKTPKKKDVPKKKVPAKSND